MVVLVLVGFTIGFNRSPELGWQLVADWVLINGGLSALGALIAGGHMKDEGQHQIEQGDGALVQLRFRLVGKANVLVTSGRPQTRNSEKQLSQSR